MHDALHPMDMHPLIRDTIVATRPGVVLEVGAGDGALRPWIQALGHEYRGIDIAPKASHVTKCDITNGLDIDYEFADVVIARAVLPHVNNHELAVDNVYHALKPGGCFVGTMPWVYGTCDVESYVHLSAAGLEALFDSVGFRKVEIEPEWPIHQSIPDLLFTGRKFAKPWLMATKAALWSVEQSYRAVRGVATLLGAPELDHAQRDRHTAGAFAFCCRK